MRVGCQACGLPAVQSGLLQVRAAWHGQVLRALP